MTSTKTNLFPEIENVITSLNFNSISAERKIVLQPLVDFIQEKATNQQEIRLNLICTHNSRRSHLSQVWAQTAAAHYGIKNVFCYSGGTEATAMFPMAAKTLTKRVCGNPDLFLCRPRLSLYCRSRSTYSNYFRRSESI